MSVYGVKLAALEKSSKVSCFNILYQYFKLKIYYVIYHEKNIKRFFKNIPSVIKYQNKSDIVFENVLL